MIQPYIEASIIGLEFTGSHSMDPWVHIVGGGLSGLSLVSSLARFKRLPGEVVISEPNPEALISKTFSFWFTQDESDFLNPEFQTRDWSLGSKECLKTYSGSGFRYGTRTGQHVLQSAMQAITHHPQITLIPELITERPTAKHVFDSRPCALDSFQLIQSFAGTEVSFNHPHEITAVSLMNDICVTDTGIRFVYVLPLGPERLLVEHTEFTTSPTDLTKLNNLNTGYLSEHFDSQSFHIIRTEEAHIPMGFRHQESHWGIPLGARGGMTRDATGYGYRTIRYACRDIGNQLVESNRPIPYQKSALTNRADQLFLKLIAKRPDVIPKVLLHIANNMTPDRFAAFMMMRAPVDLLHILRAAPVKPFICALLGRYQWI